MGIDLSRPLRRNVHESMLGGVCSGLGDYLGWDHTVVRVLAILVVLFTSIVPGVIAYVVLWIITPPAGVGSSAEQAPPHSSGSQPGSPPHDEAGPGQTGGGI